MRALAVGLGMVVLGLVFYAIRAIWSSVKEGGEEEKKKEDPSHGKNSKERTPA